MALFGWIVVFIVSLTVLIKASDYFIDSAEKIGLKIKIPRFVIGATLVAMGTSMPELISSIYAVIKGSSEIVAGNVVGSNISNILLILAIGGIISKQMPVKKSVVNIDLPILILSCALMAITMYDGVFSFSDGLIFILFLVFYNIYLFNVKEDPEDANTPVSNETGYTKMTPIILIASTFFLYLGAKYTIDSVIEISNTLNIGKEIIAITAIALGTSLPELIVTISATKKGKPEIILGNILGSNIFNSLAVMGIPALFGNLMIPPNIIYYALPVMIVASLFFWLFTIDRKITRLEGVLLLTFYVVFIAGLFVIRF